MFGRKRNPGDDDKALPQLAEELGLPTKPGARPPGAAPAAGAASSRPAMPPRPIATDQARPSESSRVAAAVAEAPKPTVETTRAPTPPTPVKRDAEIRKLIVGREISLSGEITACDRLVVEGSVEANLANCRDIDIAESGLFKGSASIDDAEIRGRFEGTLNVRRRLLIRASGKVIGTVRYGQIEIECGGQISGDVQAQPMSDVGEAPAIAPRPTIVP
ncbi:MAG TPA: polymer-forming cytoskeletal protein [Stellaceae bacterium]|nr:polymer-forming cytoskeletal protein [Stellaceae bacterium]